MSQPDILEVPAERLVNIEDVTINPSLPVAQRLNDYLEKIKNPYIFYAEM